MRNLTRQLGLALVLMVGSSPLKTPAASLTLTPAGVAQGLSLTTFASGFPTYSESTGVVGPVGIAFPTSGGVLVTDVDGNVRLFPTDADNQNAASAPIGQNYGGSNAQTLAQVGGAIYMTQEVNGNVVQINNNGTFNQYILTGLRGYVGIAADPANGHLFVANPGNNAIFDVNPITKTSTLFVSVISSGLSFSPDGKTLYASIYDGRLAGHLVGFDTTTKAEVYDSGLIPAGLLTGTAVGTGLFSGLIFANTNVGTVIEVTLGSNPVQTTIATGGSRGDNLIMDPSTNTLLITQSDSILRLNGASFTTPEPASLVMAGTAGLVGLGYTWRRRKRAAA